MRNYLILFLLFINIFALGTEKINGSDVLNLKKILKKAKFEKGIIYLKNDSIIADLLIFKRKYRRNKYLYCINKQNNDSVKVYSADEIEGYRIKNEYYKKFISKTKHFFIHKIKTGKAELYERYSIPTDDRFLYIIKLPDYNDYFIINPNENSVKVNEITESSGYDSNTSTLLIESTGVDEKFKLFISTHFNDCNKVVNMVKAGFYTISNIPSIVEVYNNCFLNK